MNRTGALTLKILEQAKQRMVDAAQREYKENGFIIFNGKRIKWDGNEKKFIAENIKRSGK